MIERRSVDALIVGGGPAGLAAATGLWYSGIRDILIVERESTSEVYCASAFTTDSALPSSA